MNKTGFFFHPWIVGEFALGMVGLVYFLTYPRNTLSDFIVLTVLCLLLRLSFTKIGLELPNVQPFSKGDRILVIFTMLLFGASWIYGFIEGKVTMITTLTALGITIAYLYYAFIQHFLAQRYLALRCLGLTQKNSFFSESQSKQTVAAALLTGLIFGVLHIPYPGLILPAGVGGFLYAYYFLTTGRFWNVVVSHAFVSSAAIYWLLDDNPFTELMVLF